MKSFDEALKDGFQHITEVTDPVHLGKLRSDGVQVDDEGYYSFFFGEHKEYELRIEPILDEGMYYVSMYQRNVLLTEKLPMKAIKRDVDLDHM